MQAVDIKTHEPKEKKVENEYTPIVEGPNEIKIRKIIHNMKTK